jgi:CRP-like cAMP-binding protein
MVRIPRCYIVKVPLAELTSGDSFGELALIQKAPRQATVVTVTPTEVIVLDKPTYDAVIKVSYTINICVNLERANLSDSAHTRIPLSPSLLSEFA